MIAPPKPPSQDKRELLIKEARARRLLGAAGVAIAAAVGLSIYAFVTGRTQQTVPAAAGHPRAATACSAAGGWRLRLDPRGWSEPTGQHTAPFVLTRTGTQACALDGYPSVVLLNAQGRKLDFRYSHRGDLVVAARTPHAVQVGGHSSAFFMLNKYRCDIRALSVAGWLRVSLPGVRDRLTLRLPRYPILDYCPAEAPSRTIAVSPIVGSLAAAAGP